ncbi:MAG: hypothetical protein II084_07390, partial [Clostridia bacterium]|nr:hypothetical protein [Clostridia bacterium]
GYPFYFTKKVDSNPWAAPLSKQSGGLFAGAGAAAAVRCSFRGEAERKARRIHPLPPRQRDIHAMSLCFFRILLYTIIPYLSIFYLYLL